MKKSKRILSFLLVVALAFGMVAVAANAADYSGVGYEGSIYKLKLVADKTTAAPGDTVTVSVYLTHNYWSGGNGSTSICYDTTYFKDFGSTDFPVDPEADPLVAKYPNTSALTTFVSDGYLTLPSNDYTENYVRACVIVVPATMRPDALAAKYQQIFVRNTYNSTLSTTANMADNVLMEQIKFVVKDDAENGTATITVDPSTCMTAVGTMINGVAQTAAQTGNKRNTYQAVAKTEGLMQAVPAKKFAESIDLTEATLNITIQASTPQADPCDYSALNTALALTPAQAQDKYTEATWSAYAAAKSAAEGIATDLLDEGTNQADINTAASALTTAFNALALKDADFTALDAAITAATYTTNTEDFTADSWNTYIAARNAAVNYDRTGKNILNQTEISALATALTNATAALASNTYCSMTALETALDAYDNIPYASNPQYYYTSASWNAVDAAYDAATDYDPSNPPIYDEATQAAINAAAQDLTDAIEALAFNAADKSDLQAAYDAATATDSSLYTSASWTTYNNAKTAASALLQNEELDILDQGDIDDAADALYAATSGLTALDACDYSALDTALALTPAQTEDKYTAATWTAYSNAKSTAEGISRTLLDDEGGANQASINQAATDLTDAFNALALKTASYTALQAAVDASTATNPDLYTAESWAPYWAARQAAVALLADQTLDILSQGTINDAASALNTARGNLVGVGNCDYEALDTALALTPAQAQDKYTEATWSAYASAKTDAESVVRNLPNVGTNQADINAAASVLTDAFNALALKPADFTALDAAIAGATATDDTLYTTASWSAYASAKTAATGYDRAGKTILDNATIAGLATALSNATTGLTFKPADFTALDAAIAGATATDDTLYTAASWSAYASAKAAATGYDRTGKDIRDNAAIAALATALSNATTGLTFKPADFTALDAAIAGATATDDTLYTSASWSAYASAKAAATGYDRTGKDIRDNAAIAGLATALSDATAGLTFKPADFTALDAAIAGATATDDTLYTTASWSAYASAKTAATGYDRAGKTILDNATIAGLATALSEATAALEALPLCNYANLDDAIATCVAPNPSHTYTTATWNAYTTAKAAAAAISRTLVADEAGANQATIDEAELALETAFANLEAETANVVNVELDEAFAADPYYSAALRDYDITIKGRAEKVQIIDNGGGTTRTYTRYHDLVTVASFTADGTPCDSTSADLAYEVWTVNMTLYPSNYTARAKYRTGWDTTGRDFAIEFDTLPEPSEAPFTIAKNQLKIGELTTLTIKTNTGVSKVQLVFPTSTSTYSGSAYYTDVDGIRVWTITRGFARGACDIGYRTKTGSQWTAGTDTVSITVTK